MGEATVWEYNLKQENKMTTQHKEKGLGLDLIVEVRRLVQAAKTRSKSGRCRYSDDLKLRILIFTEDLINQGFQDFDASEILGVQLSTLRNWMKEERSRSLSVMVEVSGRDRIWVVK